MLRATALIVLMLTLTNLFGQTTLSFCASVEPNGYCIFNNVKFISTPDSNTTRIYMEVRNPDGISSTKITYKIYIIDKDGKETLAHSLEQEIQKDWAVSWQPEIFPSPGKFSVKVFNDAGQQICGKAFELFRDW